MKQWLALLTPWQRKGILLLWLTLMVACGRAESISRPAATAVLPTPIVTIDPSPFTINSSLTPTATITPSPTTTNTPTPTSTPTPTAIPLTLSGDPYTIRLHAPTPTGNAPCGLVDVLDFPIDPPHAANINRGGQDFGVYRQRYLKNHVGEDWGGPGGRDNNFGTPVHSIGHGWVTYAEPEGWNRDKGVVIIRHILADGTTFLSFYGHLDPPSVTLQPGDCVLRGQQVGNIGRPRSSPHLHFEIRTHMPYTPGPGYWTEDPTLAGWLPPSQTIWQQRIASSPGVQWTRPFTTTVQPIGQLNQTSFALIEDNQFININPENGRLTPTLPITHEVDHALISEDQTRLYTANRLGQLAAYQLPDLTPLWQLELESSGPPLLMPIPGGSLAVAIGQNLFGINADGRLRWQQNLGGRPFAHTTTTNQLILTTTGPNHATWLISPSSPPLRITALTGYPVDMGSETWLYAEDGLYRLNPSRVNPELITPLPPANLLQSRIIPLLDGGVLLAHADRSDHRLITLNADGSLRWQRSYQAITTTELHLLTLNDLAYLVTVAGHDSIRTLNVYAIDLQTADLTHIFSGGTRTAVPSQSWATTTSTNTLLINISGGHLFNLNPALALEKTAPSSE